MFETASKKARQNVLNNIKKNMKTEALRRIKKPSDEDEAAEETRKEAEEHPKMSMNNIRQIVRDHMNSGKEEPKESEPKQEGSGTHIHLHIGK